MQMTVGTFRRIIARETIWEDIRRKYEKWFFVQPSGELWIVPLSHMDGVEYLSSDLYPVCDGVCPIYNDDGSFVKILPDGIPHLAEATTDTFERVTLVSDTKINRFAVGDRLISKENPAAGIYTVVKVGDGAVSVSHPEVNSPYDDLGEDIFEKAGD
jgi:hypothetical protein